MRLQGLLVAYGLANAALYSTLLPLWEGFDEPFHFGYVQHLANGQGLPDPRASFLSGEVGASLLIAPASRAVQQNLPEVTTYSEYFASSHPDRTARQKQLRELRPDSRWENSHFLNYEAHHAPLAYLLLAVPERAFAFASLPNRVLILRMIGALTGVLLLYFGAERLFTELSLPDPYKSAAIFCVFSSQMTWATMAHVANDWLAVPLTVWSLTMVIRYSRSPSFRTAAMAAGLLSLGLLTKAYFFALIPVALVPCLLLRRWKHLCMVAGILLVAAGPWYARNILRYGAITGMQEARAGIGATAVLHAAPKLDWPKAAATSLRAALWTGNNSFQSFSVATLTTILVVWLVALILWIRSPQKQAEWITLAHCALFLAALGYITVVYFLNTRGAATGPSPWFSQVLLAPMLGLAFLGSSRSRRLGRAVTVILTLLFGYVLIATYLVKLVPLYGGYEGRTSLALLIGLYSNQLTQLTGNLSLTVLGPASLLPGLILLVVSLALAQMIVLTRSLIRAAQS